MEHYNGIHGGVYKRSRRSVSLAVPSNSTRSERSSSGELYRACKTRSWGIYRGIKSTNKMPEINKNASESAIKRSARCVILYEQLRYVNSNMECVVGVAVAVAANKVWFTVALIRAPMFLWRSRYNLHFKIDLRLHWWWFLQVES